MYGLVFGLQVFQTASEKVESAGLSALSAITSCLSRTVLTSVSGDALRAFLELVLKGISDDHSQSESHLTGTGILPMIAKAVIDCQYNDSLPTP